MWWHTGPHLRRRMGQESANADEQPTLKSQSTFTRTSKTFFEKATDVEEFCYSLTVKFGSVTKAWRLGLDTDESGSLDFREFCVATKAIGYVGNLRTLWFNLDKDNSGSISLKELDREAAAALEKFRAISTARFDTIPNMWNCLLDQDRSGTVSLLEFTRNLRELGYSSEEESFELFQLLIVRPGSTYITLSDIMFLQNWDEAKRESAHRKRLGKGWVNKDPYLWGAVQLPGTTGEQTDEDFVAIDDERSKEDFRQFLRERYGSLPRAFECMDANGTGSLSMVEFQSVVSTVLRYCRQADARRLFLIFNQDPGAMMTWDELGISRPEWINYMLEKRMKERARQTQAVLTAAAKLGSSPRMQGAESQHVVRLKEGRPRTDMAFGGTLPKGWGFPPDYQPQSARSVP